MSKGIPVGLDMLYYAVMTEDDESYATPERIEGVAQATVTPTTNSATFFGDDKAYEVATALGDIQFSLNVASLSNKHLSDLLGHKIDDKGGLVRSSDDNAPYVAIGYKRTKSNGKSRYIWLYKGKFSPEEQDGQTKTDTPQFQPTTITATFVSRKTDGYWQYVINEDDDGVDPTLISEWFNSVPLPEFTPTP